VAGRRSLSDSGVPSRSNGSSTGRVETFEAVTVTRVLCPREGSPETSPDVGSTDRPWGNPAAAAA
jgi:hypothetical protein